MLTSAWLTVGAAEAGGVGSLLAVAVGAVGVGLPALLYSIWRGRSMGPKEEDDLVSRTAEQTIRAMGDVLTATHDERTGMLERIVRLEADVAVKAARIVDLEGQLRVLESG